MDSITPTLLLKALDGLYLRAEATAGNIANASSPGYRPVRVTFEAALAQAAGRDGAAVQAVRPTLERVLPSGSEGVRIDMELALAASTATRYAALSELLNRQAQIHALAVTGGR